MAKKIMLSICALATLLCCCLGTRSTGTVDVDMAKVFNYTNVMPVAVIGSGPAGLMAAIYGQRGGKETFIIEGNKPGGLLMDTTEVENWPGEVFVKGPEIIEKLKTQARRHGVRFVEDSIERVDFSQWPFKLYTENGDTIHALSVVVATGASPKKLDVPGASEYWGTGVTSCAVCDAPFFKNQEVVVVGGGDSAIEEAIQLAPYASKITILVRKDQLRAAASMQARLPLYDKITIKYNVEITKVVGDGTKVTAVELLNNKTNERTMFETGGVFLAIGHMPASRVFKGSIDLDDAGYIKVTGRTQQTSVRGVFAAGDVEDHRYRQAGSSAGSGINAGLDAVRFLDDNGYTPQTAVRLKPRLFGSDMAPELTHKSGPEFAKMVESLQDFDALLAGTQGIVVVDFWAETCPSCKQMLPIFHAVAQDFKDKVTFATVDTDKSPQLVDKLFVNKVPCLLVFRDGGLVARYNNAMSRKELASFIERFLDEQEAGEKD